ncbi:DUF998 domain-containing protein [Metallosphaera tengchongensis]|uniref:DUF998 domain-containing protein n=1 Tax=Metallosphaera tengchongensis TaxID=1532350 RepID=A0A6N0NW47_9CREN|nr:DUF998 domain-containing protein [Metallosphaera tengchongensis]QKR00437.1 DUF998 domain-containing protein [Metallosphaera tengchongensis]
MKPKTSLGGKILVISVAQFWIFMLLSEELYKGYNLNQNYISDLGVGSTAIIFNSSIVLMGILIILSGLLFSSKILSSFLIIGAIGMIGVGVFPETTGTPHLISALLAFLFSSLASFPAFKMINSNLRYLFPILGVISLISLVFFIFHDYGPIGPGGVERFIVLPDIVWAISFGSIMGSKNETQTTP